MSSSKDFYEANYDLITEVIRTLAENNGLTVDEVEEFASDVHFKLIRDDYRVMRGLRRPSRLRKFLITVVSNEILDFRIRKWGKWRPSVAAQKLGTVAILMERLTHRDGYRVEEAIEIAKTNHGVHESRHELRELVDKLPAKRRRFSDRPQGRDLHRPGTGGVESIVVLRELAPMVERIQPVFSKALAELDAEERVLFRLFYQKGFTWSQIARVRGFRRRSLYSAKDQMHRKLRGALEEEGIDWQRIEQLIEYRLLDLTWER